MEIGRGLAIAAAGMATVFVALAAMWLAMVILGRLPSKPSAEKTAAQPPQEEAPSGQPQEEEVVVMAAALLQAQQGGAAPSPTRRPLSPWRAVVRVVGAPFRDRGD